MSKQLSFDEFLKEAVFSVSEFLDYVNTFLNSRKVSVQGEVTGANIHQTGFYFSMKDKDDGSVMDCYINPFMYRGLGFSIEDGMEVKVSGIPSVYKAKGRFSFRVESVELAGEGSLKKAYELLKKKLEEEGLFKRKRPLPEFISSIGIITSKTGAVIDDFRKNLSPLGMKLHLYDSRVEGFKAVPSIIKGITWFNTHMPALDVIVIMRGGGSLEDLQAFNNEFVARAVFSSSIPTLCAIGHDRDVPIASLVGDIMTSTPSIAAVTVNASWNRLTKRIPILEVSFLNAFSSLLQSTYEHIARSHNIIVGAFKRIFSSLEYAEARVKRGFRHIEIILEQINQVVLKRSHFLSETFERFLNEMGFKIKKAESFISAMNPERNLHLGYSIVRNNNGKIIRSVNDITPGETLKTKTGSGEFTSTVRDVILP